MMQASDKGIPQDLLDKARCVVVPGIKKAGFIFGAKYGRGFAVCRPRDVLHLRFWSVRGIWPKR
jgi:lipid-binding SYLF domain-containing protein